MAAAFVFAGTKFDGAFVNVATTANAYTQLGHQLLGVFLAIVLLNASIIGAGAVTLSTSYAFGDVFGVRHSLHRKLGEAKAFYGTFMGMIVLAGAIVLIPSAPLGLLTLAVQALAGILLPSATVFLVLLCNDRDVLGPWVNRPWLNAVAAVIVGLLVMLSLILAAVTLFPDINANLLTGVLGIILGASLLGMGVVALVQRRSRGPNLELAALARTEKETWRMPPLEELTKPTWSVTRTIGMLTLRLYLVIAVILLVVKVIQLAIGH